LWLAKKRIESFDPFLEPLLSFLKVLFHLSLGRLRRDFQLLHFAALHGDKCRSLPDAGQCRCALSVLGGKCGCLVLSPSPLPLDLDAAKETAGH
jgi:hypothetical protein